MTGAPKTNASAGRRKTITNRATAVGHRLREFSAAVSDRSWSLDMATRDLRHAEKGSVAEAAALNQLEACLRVVLAEVMVFSRGRGTT